MLAMKRRHLLLPILLMLLALVVAISGVFLNPNPHEIIVPIDRSASNRTKPDQNAAPSKAEQTDPVIQKSATLKFAPDPRLIEPAPSGSLPRKAENGDRPLDLYARPVDEARINSARPKLAFAILNSGISEIMTAEAYLALPADVSFVMSPYARDAERQMRDIRNRGHEVFLSFQSKSETPSREDRGPYALDPAKDIATNREFLYWAMSRMTGYVGLIGDLTNAASQSQSLQELIKRETRSRGLAYFSIIRADSTTSKIESEFDQATTTPRVILLSVEQPDKLKIELDLLLQNLQNDKKMIILAALSPLAIDGLKTWLEQKSASEFDLVPLSAFLRIPERI